MNGDKPITGIKKRQQIAGTRQQMFIWVAAASAAIVICVMVGINFIQRINYQMKVNSKVTATADTLDSSVDSIDGLINNVNTLRPNPQLNLPNLKTDDSTVFQVAIDALPTENDSVSLSSSLQNRILSQSGVTIESISVDSILPTASYLEDDDDALSEIAYPVAQTISFNVSVVGPYDSVKQLLLDIERTIRPISIDASTLEGTDEMLSATITATTYYSPSVDYTVGSEEVPYEEE